MALIRQIDLAHLERDVKHLESSCTCSVVFSEEGEKQLQLDTYGSSHRKIKGKKSQSIRLTSAAIDQLKRILAEGF